MPPFHVIWQRITHHAGQTFTLVRGNEFTYDAHPTHIVRYETGRVTVNIHIGQFEQAYALVPLHNVAQIHNLFAPSFIYAILMDARIKQTDW
jgi:hypothetical protein